MIPPSLTAHDFIREHQLMMHFIETDGHVHRYYNRTVIRTWLRGS